jgi:exopolysaccharide biosynthesis WecB/TagA/CpsF family protein
MGGVQVVKTYLTVYFGTVLTAMFLVPLVSRVARKYRFVDDPGPRKVHEKPIPRIGGIALFLSTLSLIAFTFFVGNHLSEYLHEVGTEFLVLLIASSFVFAVGLIDDLYSLPGYVKLLCVIGASIAICASGASLNSISVGRWFEYETGWAAWPLTLLWITTITVCMNFVDGLDGLAAGTALIVCGTIALMAFLSGQIAMVILMLALLGSVTGFLFFNFYPAKIFMGDCGSMFLGFMIGAGSVVCQAKTPTFIGLAAPFLALGVPILDTGIAVIRRRIVERRSIFAADQNHLHHRLLNLGLHQRTVVIVIYAITGISASLGVLMMTVEGGWSVALFGIGLLLLLALLGCLHGGRLYDIILALKRNRTIVQESKIAKHDFEDAETRMRNARSFGAWWQTLSEMAQQMNFQSLGIWNRHRDHYVLTREWSIPDGSLAVGKTMRLTLPLHENGITKWELRARIWINDFLELSGHQAMLLARLMDEFPPPELEQEAELLDRHSETTVQSEADEIAAESVTTLQTVMGTEHVPNRLDIMGIPVVPFESYDQALECVERIVETDSKSFWVAINPIKIYHAWNDSELRNLLVRADVGICDGVGVSIASRILHGQDIERCTGCDLFFKLLSLASLKGWGVYLLGASPESNAAARSNLQKMYPDLKIVGWQDGYFEDSLAVVRQINSSKAKLVFVAMGSPKQEYWIQRYRQAIKANFCMGVGGSFDVAAGRLARAPKVFRMTGTEFLYRLIREPRKRWRIQKVLIPYFFRVIEKKLADVFVLGHGRVDQAKQ